jgi:hypothetical protein
VKVPPLWPWTPRRNGVLTARNADRHDLYQRAVQDVEAEGRFLSGTFERIAGRKAASLREDFCGTALLCAGWVKQRGRTAVGVSVALNFSYFVLRTRDDLRGYYHDANGDGIGRYRARTHVAQEPAWVAYIIAER